MSQRLWLERVRGVTSSIVRNLQCPRKRIADSHPPPREESGMRLACRTPSYPQAAGAQPTQGVDPVLMVPVAVAAFIHSAFC